MCLGIAACSEADMASRNLSQAADQFEINRRLVFYNVWKGETIFVVEGLCSLGNQEEGRKRTVTCKIGPNSYKKHFLGLSDNVTYFAEQLDASPANVYRYRVIFAPSAIIPDIDLRIGK